MNPDTGDMKEMTEEMMADLVRSSKQDSPMAKFMGYKLLPKEGTVLEIQGFSFVVDSYDVNENKMILKGISKYEAKSRLING